jgi:hypothetical protein
VPSEGAREGEREREGGRTRERGRENERETEGERERSVSLGLRDKKVMCTEFMEMFKNLKNEMRRIFFFHISNDKFFGSI